MNPFVKQWAEALRSGKYKQGRTQLRTSDNEYCCLGVACDIVDSTLWKKESDLWCYRDFGAFTPATDPFKRMTGIDWRKHYPMPAWINEKYGFSHIWISLVNLNDFGVSFEDIARFIEENC